MDRQEQVRQRREEIAKEMVGITSMRRGTLNEQFWQSPRNGRKGPVTRGPYYVFSRKEHGVTVSQRVSGEEVERVREGILGYGRFVALCKEFADLTEELGDLERAEGPEAEALKKGLKPRSSRARKSHG